MNALELKHAVAERLRRDKWLRRKQVTIIADDAGDIAEAVRAALAGLGIAVIVGNLGATAKSAASRAIVCESQLVVSVVETPLANRGRADHADCAAVLEHIAGALNLAPLKPPREGEPVLPVFISYRLAPVSHAEARGEAHFSAQTTISPPDEG